MAGAVFCAKRRPPIGDRLFSVGRVADAAHRLGCAGRRAAAASSVSPPGVVSVSMTSTTDSDVASSSAANAGTDTRLATMHRASGMLNTRFFIVKYLHCGRRTPVRRIRIMLSRTVYHGRGAAVVNKGLQNSINKWHEFQKRRISCFILTSHCSGVYNGFCSLKPPGQSLPCVRKGGTS